MNRPSRVPRNLRRRFYGETRGRLGQHGGRSMSPRFVLSALLALGVVCASVSPAHAQQTRGTTGLLRGDEDAAEPARAGDTDEVTYETLRERPEPVGVEDRRPIPDLDGRGGPTRRVYHAMWPLRSLLAPAYFVAEYVLRRPLTHAVTAIEREDLITKANNALHFGPNDELLLVPTFNFDFGLRANMGGIFRYQDALGIDGNKIGISYTTAGFDPPFHAFTFNDTYGGDGWSLSVGYQFLNRADQFFFGIGSEADEIFESRFAIKQNVGHVTFALQGWRDSSFSVSTRLDQAAYGDAEAIGGRRGLGPSIRERQAELANDPDGPQLNLPAAFPDPDDPDAPRGYAIHSTEVRFTIDSHEPRQAIEELPDPELWGPTARGRVDVRIDGLLALNYSLRGGAAEQLWLEWGGAVTGYVDVSGIDHVLALSFSAHVAEALNGEIPFTLLPDLGGTGPLPGFRPRFLVGESLASLSLEYTWPIWVLLRGNLKVAVGNAFDSRFNDFALDNLRMNFDMGIQFEEYDKVAFKILFGLGTSTFEDGLDLQGFRFFVGGTRFF